jgi:hypothetical protein
MMALQAPALNERRCPKRAGPSMLVDYYGPGIDDPAGLGKSRVAE